MITKPPTDRDVARLRELASQRDHGISDAHRAKLCRMGFLQHTDRPYALTERGRRLLAGLALALLAACGGSEFTALLAGDVVDGGFSPMLEAGTLPLELEASADAGAGDEVRADREIGSGRDAQPVDVVDDASTPDRVSFGDAPDERPTAVDTGAPDTWVAPVCCYVHCSGPAASPVPCSLATCPPGGGACSYMTCMGYTGGC